MLALREFCQKYQPEAKAEALSAVFSLIDRMSPEQVERWLTIGEALVSTPKVRACSSPDDTLSSSTLLPDTARATEHLPVVEPGAK